MLTLPRRPRGRLSAEDGAQYQRDRRAFCKLIIQINSTLDFAVGVRGRCYILEGRGHISKGEFVTTERFITDCRKSGELPLNICAEDASRTTVGLQELDSDDPDAFAQGWIEYLRDKVPSTYTPVDFWDDKKVYVEIAVEKLDLRNLFQSVCDEFFVPITNLKGWSDLNARAAMMYRFARHEDASRRCVLLMCNDHDPAGLLISDTMHKNLADLTDAVGWSPHRLTIERFGLNSDFISRHRLVWIDNLETSSGERLDNPRHQDHHKAYVQDYLAQYGAKKCEANALVAAPEIGRQLCREAILCYVPANTPPRYRRRLLPWRRRLREAIQQRLTE